MAENRDVTGLRRPRRDHSKFGSDRERKIAALLRDEGWVVFRTPGSFGVCDLVALRAAEERWREPFARYPGAVVQMIEVKGTARSPWVAWGPAERQELVEAARKAGATPMLAWWPPHGPLQWLGVSEWPDAGRRPEDVSTTASAD